jgi:hypothetical protein
MLFKSYGNFVQARAESSSLLECYAECRRNSSKKKKPAEKLKGCVLADMHW